MIAPNNLTVKVNLTVDTTKSVSKKDLVKELNKLLRVEKLDLPSFRRSVTVSGKNVHWLAKNIKKQNKGYNPRIDVLLTELVAA